MATPKKPKKAAPARAKKPLAPVAPPVDLDDPFDDQLVDTSGTFRAVSSIAQAQIGHEEEPNRFPNESLVMRAQREGFVTHGPSLAEVADEHVAEDEATSAQKRERLATLAALDEKRRKQQR